MQVKIVGLILSFLLAIALIPLALTPSAAYPEAVPLARQANNLPGRSATPEKVACTDTTFICTGRPDRIFQTGHTAPVTAVAFSPDGTWLATGSYDATVRLWEASPGREIRSRADRWNNVMALAFVAKSRLLFSAGTDEDNQHGFIEMYDPEQDRQLLNLPIVAQALSSDGRWAAARDLEKIKLWEVGSNQERGSLPSAWVDRSPAVAFSPDGRWLAVRGTDFKTVTIWDVTSRTIVRRLAGHTRVVTTLAFSQNGRRIASGSDVGRVRIWDRETGQQISLLSGQGPIVEVAFSPDGKWLAAGDNGYAPAVLKVWNVEAGRELITLSDQTNPVIALAVSPDGKWLAANSEKDVHVWDTNTWNLKHTLVGHVQRVGEVVFTPDSQRLISASTDDGVVKIWDVREERIIKTLRIPIAYLNTVTVSPDGKRLASGGVGEAVEIWELASGRKLQTLTGHRGSVVSIAFNPDGQWLATGDGGDSVRRWDLSTGRLLSTILMGGRAIALSPDGRRLAATDGYGVVKLYETSTGTPLQVMMTGENSSGGLAFSPDGVWVASGGLKSTVNLWRTVPSR